MSIIWKRSFLNGGRKTSSAPEAQVIRPGHHPNWLGSYILWRRRPDLGKEPRTSEATIPSNACHHPNVGTDAISAGVASQLGVHPDTVRNAIESERFNSTPALRESIVGPYTDFIVGTEEINIFGGWPAVCSGAESRWHRIYIPRASYLSLPKNSNSRSSNRSQFVMRAWHDKYQMSRRFQLKTGHPLTA